MQVYEGVHLWDCNIRNGYDAVVLTETQIRWLQYGRMVCVETEVQKSAHDDECHDYGHFLTRSGRFNYPRGFLHRIIPDTDGVSVHDACWNILSTAQETTVSNSRKLDLQEIFHDLKQISFFLDQPPSTLDTEERALWSCDAFLEAVNFQNGISWSPVKGYERIVADPFIVNFELLVDDCIGIEHSGINGLIIPSPASEIRDPFADLPTELLCAVIELLPSRDLFRLAITSPCVKSIATNLPRAFWKSRILLEMPWLQPVWPRLSRALKNSTQPVQYKKLLRDLKDISHDFQEPIMLYDDYFEQWGWIGLQNLRRIWECCESILKRVEIFSAVSRVEKNRVSAELRSRTFEKVVTIGKPSLSRWGQSEAFFVPRIDEPPEVRVVTIYFRPGTTTITGIEFSLEGESSGGILGNRYPSLQSVTLPPKSKIRGFVLCLGPASDMLKFNDEICGLGILTEDCPLEPRIKLGSWTGDDVVQVFRLEGLDTVSWHLKNYSVVGIIGHFDRKSITGFGLLIADLSKDATNSRSNVIHPQFAGGEMYYRWVSNYPSVPGHFVRGQNFIPIISSQQNLPYPIQYRRWSVFVDLSTRYITRMTGTFYTYVGNTTCRKLELTFSDGGHQVIRSYTEIPESRITEYHLRFGQDERILGGDCWMILPYHRFRFYTNYDRTLYLGKPMLQKPNARQLSWSCPEYASIVGLTFHIYEHNIGDFTPVLGRRVSEAVEQ